MTPDYLICLEDGKKLKMLKRHLRTNYDLSPEQYRLKWGLPSDYPDGGAELRGTAFGLRQEIGLGAQRPTRLTALVPAALGLSVCARLALAEDVFQLPDRHAFQGLFTRRGVADNGDFGFCHRIHRGDLDVVAQRNEFYQRAPSGKMLSFTNQIPVVVVCLTASGPVLRDGRRVTVAAPACSFAAC